MPTPIIIAHRGLHEIHPENSLPAFAAAWAADMEWCECDVHATVDGVPMVIHDATLERTTQLQGAVAERTMAELRGAIPSLAEVLDAMPDDRGLLIEIKPVADAALVSAVIEQSRGRRCVIQSFDAQNVRWAMEQNVPTALLVETEDALAEAAGGDWQSLNIATGLLTSPAIVGLRQRGASIGVWTINTEQDIRSACQFGVDRIITDNPMLARKITEISTR